MSDGTRIKRLVRKAQNDNDNDDDDDDGDGTGDPLRRTPTRLRNPADSGAGEGTAGVHDGGADSGAS